MIRVVIAEQHAILRWALREALAKTEGFQLVGDAGTAQDTLALIERERPDILLLDLALSGPDLVGRLREIDEAPVVLLLACPPSSEIERVQAARALADGAHGYVGLDATPDELVEAIRAVSRGERVVPANVDVIAGAGDANPASVLTQRELQVMELLARGMTNREIAENLAIGLKTVDTHRGHVLKKLRLRNNSELTRFAVKHGYIAL